MEQIFLLTKKKTLFRNITFLLDLYLKLITLDTVLKIKYPKDHKITSYKTVLLSVAE